MPKGVTGEGRGSHSKPHVCGGIRGSGSGGPFKKLISLFEECSAFAKWLWRPFYGGGGGRGCRIVSFCFFDYGCIIDMCQTGFASHFTSVFSLALWPGLCYCATLTRIFAETTEGRGCGETALLHTGPQCCLIFGHRQC